MDENLIEKITNLENEVKEIKELLPTTGDSQEQSEIKISNLRPDHITFEKSEIKISFQNTSWVLVCSKEGLRFELPHEQKSLFLDDGRLS